jgi:hypothetical protein
MAHIVFNRLAVRIGGFYPFKKSAPTIGDQKDFSTRRLLLKIQIKIRIFKTLTRNYSRRSIQIYHFFQVDLFWLDSSFNAPSFCVFCALGTMTAYFWYTCTLLVHYVYSVIIFVVILYIYTIILDW